MEGVAHREECPLSRSLFAVIVVVGVVANAAPAVAHDPIFLTDDQTTAETGPLLPDGTISFALYGEVGVGDPRGFQVEFAEADPVLIEVLIPDQAPENGLAVDHLPVATVTAPDGSTITLRPEMRDAFDEPFTNTSYIGLSRLEGPALAGVYDVVISGGPARFTVAVGATETFFTPVERVENRVASFDDIGAPLAQWYDNPPSAGLVAEPVEVAVEEPDPAESPTPVPSTPVPAATPTDEPAPPVDETPTEEPDVATDLSRDAGSGAETTPVLVIAAAVVVALALSALMVLWRRRVKKR